MNRFRHNVIFVSRHATNWIRLHAEDILSVAAGIGVVTTGILSYRAGKNIANREDLSDIPSDNELDRSNGRGLGAYRVIAGPVVAAGATITCIAGCRAISRKRQASLIAAGAALAESFSAYRDAVHASVGRETRECIEENAVMNAIEFKPDNIEDTGTGDVIFIEEFTGRRFKASIEHVQKAINDFTTEYSLYGYGKLNDFYNYLKIPTTNAGDMLGWQYFDSWYFDNHDEIDFYDAKLHLGIILEDYPALGTVLRYTNLPDYVSF